MIGLFYILKDDLVEVWNNRNLKTNYITKNQEKVYEEIKKIKPKNIVNANISSIDAYKQKIMPTIVKATGNTIQEIQGDRVYIIVTSDLERLTTGLVYQDMSFIPRKDITTKQFRKSIILTPIEQIGNYFMGNMMADVREILLKCKYELHIRRKEYF